MNDIIDLNLLVENVGTMLNCLQMRVPDFDYDIELVM